MKKTFLLPAFALLFGASVLSAQNIDNTGEVSLFGLRTWATPQSSYDLGWGGGMDILSRRLIIPAHNATRTFGIQGGGGVYISGFGHRRFSGVPLAEPQTGNATVRLNNLYFGLFGKVRFSVENAGSNWRPYADLFCGLRSINSSMNIRPDHPLPGYQSSTDSTLHVFAGFTYGAGLGVLYSVSSAVAFDAELMWSYSAVNSPITNLSTAQLTGSTVRFDPKLAPSTVMMLKIGVVFRISRDHDSSSHSHGGFHTGGTTSGGGHSGGAPNSVHTGGGIKK